MVRFRFWSEEIGLRPLDTTRISGGKKNREWSMTLQNYDGYDGNGYYSEAPGKAA